MFGRFINNHSHAVKGVDFNVTMQEPFTRVVATDTDDLLEK